MTKRNSNYGMIMRCLSAALLTASLLFMSAVGAGAFERFDGQGLVNQQRRPGTECVRWSGGSPFLSYSAIGNRSSSSTLKVDCPVTRNTIYGTIKGVRVRVNDANPFSGKRLACTLVSVYRSANGAMQGRGTGPRVSGNGVSDLVFGGLTHASSNSHAYLSCQVPTTYYGRSSYLDSYMVQEREPCVRGDGRCQ